MPEAGKLGFFFEEQKLKGGGQINKHKSVLRQAGEETEEIKWRGR